ncbi:MAG TPA: outer membrane protein assembly factor BamD [Phycisphaerae bacterium]|nr:outer membrane protein assembly factor BamD [Phycisphaerae bacterium]
MSTWNRRVALWLAVATLWGLSSGTTLRADEPARRELVNGQWVTVTPPAPGTPDGELAILRRLVEQGKNPQAVRAAKKFLEKWPAEKQAEEALLLAGQAEMSQKRLFQAYEWFEKQLARFPAGPLSERALLREFEIAERFLAGEKRVALGFIRLDAEDEGLDILTRIAEHVPGSALAEKAMLRIGDHQYAKFRWDKAVEGYDQFARLFPKSDKYPYARLQAARATLASYRGVKFDETPLIEAEKRFEQFAQAHPAEAAQADVARTLQQIALRRAEKIYETGTFYERVHRPSSAVFYYRQVMAQYPASQYAAQARQDLARLGERAAPAPASQPAPTEEPPAPALTPEIVSVAAPAATEPEPSPATQPDEQPETASAPTPPPAPDEMETATAPAPSDNGTIIDLENIKATSRPGNDQ